MAELGDGGFGDGVIEVREGFCMLGRLVGCGEIGLL